MSEGGLRGMRVTRDAASRRSNDGTPGKASPPRRAGIGAVVSILAGCRGRDRVVACVHGRDGGIGRSNAGRGRQIGPKAGDKLAFRLVRRVTPTRETVGMSKRILVTGGAGFVGTHLVEHLVGRGDEVVVLDSLEPQVHLGQNPSSPTASRSSTATSATRGSSTKALEGVDAVVHLAAAVGVGQSMYEIERYVRTNTHRDGQRSSSASSQHRARPNGSSSPPRCRSTARASIAVPSTEASRPDCAPRSSCSPGSGSALPDVRAELAPVPDAREQAADPDIGLRDHEARPRGAMQVVGPPTASRPSPCASSTSTVQARRSRTRTPASRRSSRRGCSTTTRRSSSRTGSSRETSSTSATSSRRSCWRSSRTPRSVTRSMSAPDARSASDEVAELIASRLDKRDRARAARQRIAAGDIRHCFADPTRAEELLGFAAKVDSRTGCGELMDGSGRRRRRSRRRGRRRARCSKARA